jgi:diguanylate cyclase (GGDEF)-like protein/PAS domain S-box-containing protein
LHITDNNSGAVGGVVVDPYLHAYEAGLMVKQILNGVDVRDIPVRTEPLTASVFNYHMLEHFNIDKSKLPPGSIILGDKENQLSISLHVAISIGIIAILLIFLLIALFTKTKQLKLENVNHIASKKKLQESNEKFRAYIQRSPVGIFIIDYRGKFIEVNQMVCEMTGYEEKELLTLSVSDYLVPKELSQALEAFSIIKEKGFVEGEFRVRKKGGQANWVSLTGAKINDTSLIAFCSDITERKARESRIEYLSFHDVVTNINNRAFFEEEVRRLDNEKYLPLSYLISDTNGLKLINDTFGHAAGDQILKETAKFLKNYLREDDILARVGGDEFAMLLPKTSSSEVQKIMEQIYLDCEGIVLDKNHEDFKVSLSLGYATKTKISEPFSHILKVAEDHMYRRKLVKRDSFHSSFLNSLKKSLFERNQETEEHAERLIGLTRMVGKALGLPDYQLLELQLLSTMHDIGKISIDNRILTKPGKLTDDEWLEMKKHPGIGYRIAMTSPDLKPIAEYILCHHERWDGTGYPQELVGENIPLLSRILSVADAYDAMVSDRPYRKALSKEIAISELINNSGTQFDPDIVKLFLELL